MTRGLNTPMENFSRKSAPSFTEFEGPFHKRNFAGFPPENRSLVKTKGRMWKWIFLVTLLVSTFPLGDCTAAQDKHAKEHSTKPLAGYSVLVFEGVKVDPAAIRAGFAEEQAPVMQAEIFVQLIQKKLFDEVIDRSETAAARASGIPPQKDGKPILLLSGTVTEFEPGSQAERYLVGLGAGAAKLKMHFSFQDSATGAEVLSTDHQHKFWFGNFGGSKKTAMNRTAEGMVKSLMDDIKHNR